MTTSRILVSAVSLLVAGLAACGGFGEDVSVGSDSTKLGGGDGGETDGGGASADGGKPCHTAEECGTGLWACAFSPTAVCGDYGKCVFYGDQAVCASIAPGCSCGNNVNLGCNGVPAGYTVGPEATSGFCSGEADASTCTNDTDCGSDGMCGFAISNGCSAVGQCYPKNTGPLCNSISPACACDGTTVNTVCEGYPSGVTSKPVTHGGACDGG